MTVEEKPGTTAYESGKQFYDRKIGTAVGKLTTAQGDYEQTAALEELEEASLKLRQLERRRTKGLV